MGPLRASPLTEKPVVSAIVRPAFVASATKTRLGFLLSITKLGLHVGERGVRLGDGRGARRAVSCEFRPFHPAGVVILKLLLVG